MISRKIALSLSLLANIAACGGGGTGGQATPPPLPPPPPPQNSAPTFTSVANTDQPENQQATYIASATDPDAGDAVSFRISTGMDAALFTIDVSSGALEFNGALPDFEAPADANGDNTYELTIEASDGSATSTLDLKLAITDVNDNPPVLTSASSVFHPENRQVNYSAAATDADISDTISYSIGGGIDANRFTIDAVSGALEFIGGLPDFEAPDDSNDDNVYAVTIVASDGAMSDSLDVAITVNDVSDLVAELTFPPAFSNLSGVAQTSVRGVFRDNEDGEVLPTDLTALIVNGAQITTDPGHPDRWSVDMVLSPGLNVVSIGYQSIGSPQTSMRWTFLNNTNFAVPLDVIPDIANQRLLVVDGGLVECCISTFFPFGARLFEVSLPGGHMNEIGFGTWNSAAFGTPGRAEIDAVNNRVIFLSHFNDRELRDISLADGTFASIAADNQRPLSQSSFADVDVNSAGTAAFLVEWASPALVQSMSLSTSAFTTISGDGVGAGPELAQPVSLELDEAQNRAIVFDFETDRLMAIDLATGDRTTVSDPAQGPALRSSTRVQFTYDLASNFTSGQAVMAAPGRNDLVQIDLATGARDVMSSPSVGSGVTFHNLRGAGFDETTNRLFVVDSGRDAVFEVDPATGDRTIVIDTGVGAGLNMLFPTAIRFDSANSRLIVLDTGASGVPFPDRDAAVFAVYIPGGDRAYISGSNRGSGPNLGEAFHFDEIFEESRILVASRNGLISVNLQTGDRTVISSNTVGTGATPFIPYAVAADPANDRAFVLDTVADSIIEVDLSSGNRTTISSAAVGSGPSLDLPSSEMLFDAGGNRIFVSELTTASILQVDPDTGDRSVVSGSGVGQGNPLSVVRGLEINDDGDTIYASERNMLVAIDIATGDTTTISRAGGSDIVLLDEQRILYATTEGGRVRVIDIDSGETAILSD